MHILIQAGQLILSLSILIILHELGHFIPARLFKIRVEKFYLFFDPWVSLFKLKKGETEYGIGWLPLGGYVKISGMVDESMDKEQMKEEPKDWEFRSKPAWQRLIVMLGGVTVNILLGFFIYMMIAFVWGEKYLPVENAKYGTAFAPAAQHLGFQNGDKILSLDGKKVEDFEDIRRKIVLDGIKTVEVNRNGMIIPVAVPDTFVKTLMRENVRSFIAPGYPFIIQDFSPDSPAKKAGFQPGDQIIAVNGDSLHFYYEFADKIKPLAAKAAKLGILRQGQRMTLDVVVSKEGFIGVFPLSPDKLLDFKTIHYGFLESVPKGINLGVATLSSYIKQFKHVFTKEGAKQLGGFGTFASLFGTTWDWYSFWNLTAFISIILAVMNILPIPALDGGHVMFLLYEIVTRRKPNQKAMEYAQMAGMILLLALFLYANGNDIFRHFRS
jgi:regulator of sigma E protease